MAILGIFLAVLIPQISNYIDQAKLSADQATLKILNDVTSHYRVSQVTTDPFEDTSNNDTELMNVLINTHLLGTTVVPQSNDASFKWIFEDEKWYLILSNETYVISLSDGLSVNSSGVLGYWGETQTYTGSSMDIVIPSTLDGMLITNIGQSIFKDVGLTSVVIEEGILRISGNSFQGNLLTSIAFPDSVQRIWHNAFNDNQLTSITFGSDLTRIEGGAFGNNQLTSLQLPPSVSYVGEGAFGYGSNYITSITIGSNVTIGNDATFGWYGKTFRSLYNEEKQSGTYIYENGQWVKQ